MEQTSNKNKSEKRHYSFGRSSSKDNVAVKDVDGEKPEEAVLPRHLRDRLHNLFQQIEEEFAEMYTENVDLRKTICDLSEKLTHADASLDKTESSEIANGVDSCHKAVLKVKSSGLSSSHLSQKLKTTYKSGTSRLVSSFKPSSGVVCRVAQEFHGHRDGIWDVDSSPVDVNIAGSASADQKAKLWDVATGACVATYHGHSGSVNCLRFHPTKSLALTVSGDASAHLWTYESVQQVKAASSDDEPLARDSTSDGDVSASPPNHHPAAAADSSGHDYRHALMRTTCHASPIVCCDWLSDGVAFVTASWDRTACVIDSSTIQTVHTLTGHDLPLTFVSAHRTHKLIVTSSRDATFRVCDFRVPTVHTVTVGQGHSQSVSSAVFTADDKVVSSSDDRCVKVWDLKSMRTPLASMRFDSPVNRISVSRRDVIAIPHDNRQVRLYDTSGIRLARLPRNDRASHRRVVTATRWVEQAASAGSLITCGWDKVLINWNVELPHSAIAQR